MIARATVATTQGALAGPLAILCDDAGYVTVPTRVAALAAKIVAERRAVGNAYSDRSFYLDDEDQYDRRLALRGGVWNARDVTRAAEGLTLSDATALRAALLAIGIRIAHDDADALLCATERGAVRTLWEASGRTGRDPDEPENRERILQEKRDRMAARRELARADGRCIVCLKVATVDGNTTCVGCQQKANARLTRRRAKVQKQKAAARRRNAQKARTA